VAVKHAGQRRSGTAPSRSAAQRLGAELLLELGGKGKDSTITVADMLVAHLAAQERPEGMTEGWSPTYHHDATAVVDRLVEQHQAFATRKIRDVTPSVLLGLYKELAKRGWTRWRVKRLHTVMGTAWQMAITYEWTASNPCRLVAPPTPEASDPTPPTSEQVVAILGQLDGLDLLAVRLNGTLGIRRGDLCGLQWSDVDTDRCELLIARSIAVTPGQRHVMPTKSGRRSHRRLAVDLPTMTLIRRWRIQQAQEALSAGLPAPLWIISSDGGASPWRPDRVSRLFRRVADRAGATGVRLHDLRHYVATSMLEDGEPLSDVAGQLGNTIATTQAVYAHWMPGRGRESVDRRAARLGNQS
jgi:integrase